MADHVTPNLPSRDFERTSQFYQRLGFEQGWRDGVWMIMRRGGLTLEFFPFPDLDPAESSFSCCLRLDDLDAFYAACRGAGIPEHHHGAPRLDPPKVRNADLRIAGLIDPDGTLLRLVQNEITQN